MTGEPRRGDATSTCAACAACTAADIASRLRCRRPPGVGRGQHVVEMLAQLPGAIHDARASTAADRQQSRRDRRPR